MAQSGNSGLSAIDRALEVLNLFVTNAEPSLGVTQIARELGLAKAVVHRILGVFCARGLLCLDTQTHRYQLGSELVVLGVRALARLDVREAAKSYMDSLVRATDETATLSTYQRSGRIYVHQVLPARDIKMVVELGRPFPLHAGASSKVLLAHLSPAERDARLGNGPLTAVTSDTIINKARLARELTAIAKAGVATSFGEREEGAGSVAAPIFDHDGQVAAVMSVCGPVERIRPRVAELSTHVSHAAHAISRDLGFRGQFAHESAIERLTTD